MGFTQEHVLAYSWHTERPTWVQCLTAKLQAAEGTGSDQQMEMRGARLLDYYNMLMLDCQCCMFCEGCCTIVMQPDTQHCLIGPVNVYNLSVQDVSY